LEYDWSEASGPSGGGTLSSPPHISLEMGRSCTRPFSSDGGVAHTAVSLAMRTDLWSDSQAAKYKRLQSQFNGLSKQCTGKYGTKKITLLLSSVLLDNNIKSFGGVTIIEIVERCVVYIFKACVNERARSVRICE